MLRHLKEFEAAHRIEQSLLYTFGIEKAFTQDLDKNSPLSTTAFTDRVIHNLGKETDFWTPRTYKPLHIPSVKDQPDKTVRRMVGVDVYIESTHSLEELGKSLEKIALPSPFRLEMISSRSVQVYPPIEGITTKTVDHFRARFFIKEGLPSLKDQDILNLISQVGQTHQWMHTEKLFEFNGAPGFTKAQGET